MTSRLTRHLDSLHAQLNALLTPMLQGDEDELTLMRKALKVLPIFESHLRHMVTQTTAVRAEEGIYEDNTFGTD